MDAFYCRAAISLNNTGCTLLERGCYSQAFRTFSEAVSIMRDLAVSGDLVTNTLHHSSFDSVTHTVEEASGYLANAQPCTMDASKQLLLCCTSISDDETFSKIQQSMNVSILTLSSTNGVIRPSDTTLLRIEVYGTDNHTPQLDEVKYWSSVILFNNAVAFLCCSMIEPISMGICYINALRLLRLSYSVVCDPSLSHADGHLLRRLVLVRILLLKYLTLVSCNLGLLSDSNEYNHRLTDLLSSNHLQHEIHLDKFCWTARAA